MMEKNQIFSNGLEDFTKIFLATFVVFFSMLATDVLTSTLFVIVTVYFLDGGHVWSTLLEVLGDPQEVRKKYVWVVLLGSFALNFFVHLLFTSYFFYYIFYFTIYHNMRQGLGVTFLYRLGEKRAVSFVKWSYYFLTMFPFILFHLKPPMLEGKLGEAIIKPIDLFLFVSASHLNSFYKWGVVLYIAGAFFIGAWLIYKKNARGLFSMAFFAAVYAYAFLISTNEMKSYALLIFSHAIPYYFLMEKRLELTHRVRVMQKYAWIFLLVIFAIGAVVDYYQTDIVEIMEPFDSLAWALLTTPLISHFIYDAILWKRGNTRFQAFVAKAPR